MFVAHLTLFFAVLFAIAALLFFSKKQSRTGNRLIGLVMSILSFQHFMHYLWATKLVYQYTWLLNIDVPLDGCMAPLLFFYILVMIGRPFKISAATLAHFWPLPIGLIWYIYFNLQAPAFKKEFIDMAYREVPAAASIVNIMLAVYLALGYRQLDRYIKSQPHTEWVSGYSNLIWLRQFVIIMFFINVGAAPLNFIARFSYIIAGFPALTGFMLLFIVYKTFNHPEVMSNELVRKFTQQLEYQREIEKVRRQISNDIHDELGAGLTNITMVSELGKLNHKNDNAVTEKFTVISNLSSQLMTSLREVVWTMNPVHDNLNSLFAFLRQTVSSFFEPTNIRIAISTPDVNNEISIDPLMRRNLILIVKEAMNNVVKHSDADTVAFVCTVDQQTLKVKIADNGRGISEHKSVLGNGLKNIKKRVAESGGQVTITTGDGNKGVALLIDYPLNIT